MGATRRHPLRQPRPRSPALRALYRSGAWGWGLVRRDRAGMTALMSRCARQARKASPSHAAIRQDRGVSVQASTRARAWMRLWRARAPVRTGPGDGPVDPPGYGAGCGSRPGCGPERVAPISLGARMCARPTVLSHRTADRSRSACRWACRRGHPPRSHPAASRR